MATVEKIRKDIEKTKEKISAQQKRLRELEVQLTEEENLEIVRMVKAVRMDNKELTAFLKAYASGLTVSTTSPRTESISSWPTAAAPLPSPAETHPNIPRRRS